MGGSDQYYSDEPESEEELEILVDIAICSECSREFDIETGTDPEQCPHCGTRFDGEGQ